MLDGMLSTSHARLTTIVVSMFVYNTKTTLRMHPWTRILVSCADVICVFGPKHGGCSNFSYIPTRNVLQDLSRSYKTYPDKRSKIL